MNQKELEKALNEGKDMPHPYKIKARIEFIGDFEDVKKVKELLKSLEKKD